MTIVVIAAVLAALVCFRWARTLALFTMGGMGLWFWAIMEGWVR